MKSNRRVRRWMSVTAVLLVIYAAAGFFLAPPVVKSQLEKRLSAALGRRVAVDRVRLNPFALSAALENFSIAEADGRTRFLGWRRLYVNFNALASLRGEWVLSDVSLDGCTLRAVVNADGSLNVSDILARFSGSTPTAGDRREKPPRPIRIGRLIVTGARVEGLDLSRHSRFASNIGPVTFEVSGFRTAGDRGAPYRFEAVTEAGEHLAWTGTLRATPFRSAGEFRIEHVVLPKYAPYYADRLRGVVQTGTVSVRGRYEVDLNAAHHVATLQDGAIQLRDFVLRGRGPEPLVELPAVDISGIEADALAPKASVAAVTVAGGRVRVRREQDGTLDLAALLQPASAPHGAAQAATPAAAPTGTAEATAPRLSRPDVVVRSFTVKGFEAEVTDLTAPAPAHLVVRDVEFAAEGVSLAPNARIPVRAGLSWLPNGRLRAEGQVGLQPLHADLRVEATDMALLPLSPYLEQFANARLTQGTVTATLRLQADLLAGAPTPIIAADGEVTVASLGLVDAAANEELAGFEALKLRGIQAAIAPARTELALQQVDVVRPYGRLIVNRDKTVNLTTLVKTGPAAAAASRPPVPMATSAVAARPLDESSPAAPPASAQSATTPPAAAPATVQIGRITISDGAFRFTDRSIEPTVNTAITAVSGAIAGLSSAQPAKAEVALKALVDGAGPVAITGRLDPFGVDRSVDLKVEVRNVDLVPLSPYSGHYAGYELARGKLLLDVKLLLQGENIDLKNVITLNQFTFGNAVPSPDATKLPVRLGVALLKDVDGKIVIDVPVQGRIDDPEFHVGRVVVRVIVNLLTKAAVSPFSLLGAAFGGGGEELAYQEFAPGSSELQPAGIEKLNTMVRALTNRPALSLGVEGSFDAAADAYALKRVKLADRVRRAIWEQKHRTDPNLPPPERLQVTAAESAAMIKVLFDQTFPPGTQFGTPLPAAPAVVAPPPPPPGGVFSRVVRVLSFADRRAQRKAEAENARRAAEHQAAVVAAAATGLPVEEMTGRLAEAMTLDAADLQALAQARAQRVRDYFAEVGRISGDRLFLAKPDTDTTKPGKGPRVFLTLE